MTSYTETSGNLKSAQNRLHTSSQAGQRTIHLGNVVENIMISDIHIKEILFLNLGRAVDFNGNIKF